MHEKGLVREMSTQICQDEPSKNYRDIPPTPVVEHPVVIFAYAAITQLKGRRPPRVALQDFLSVVCYHIWRLAAVLTLRCLDRATNA